MSTETHHKTAVHALDDLPLLDADVAARLAEEGGTLLLPLDDQPDTGAGDDAQVSVAFPNVGVKKLVAGYARLKRASEPAD